MTRFRLIAAARTAGLTLLAGLIPLGVGCDGGDKGTSSNAPSSPATDGPPAPAPTGANDTGATGGGGKAAVQLPVVKLTPEAFAAEFMKSHEGTFNKYAQNRVEISGTVTSVMTNAAGDPTVVIRGKEAEPIVQCYTTDKQPWAKLARGQTVTMRGSLGYMPIVPNIEKCEIVTAGEPTAVARTAAELVADYAKDPKAFGEGKTRKDLLVSGKVLEKTPTMIGGTKLVLEGAGGVNVVCELGMLETELPTTGQVQPGQTVKVFGELSATTPPPNTVQLVTCHLVTQ
jgi:hypothetical protein